MFNSTLLSLESKNCIASSPQKYSHFNTFCNSK
uniref:Uncharacterized protein n=1 Tax=Anguilla anguilla TaxID=7936 RepID=A0A0E9WGT5_ANGAN